MGTHILLCQLSAREDSIFWLRLSEARGIQSDMVASPNEKNTDQKSDHLRHILHGHNKTYAKLIHSAVIAQNTDYTFYRTKAMYVREPHHGKVALSPSCHVYLYQLGPFYLRARQYVFYHMVMSGLVDA